jgi:hypothetical protein
MSIPRSIQLGAVLALILGVATTASARNLSMTGEWFMNRGPLIDIPVNGGAIFCGGGAPNGCIGQGGFNIKPQFGGIQGAATIMTVAPGGNFVIPPNAFAQAAGKQVAAVPFVPTVVQMSTTWTLMGPPTAAQTPAVPAVNIPAAFMKSAWLLDPGQGGRLQKSFTFCPLVTATILPQNCTNSANGPYTGQVKYVNSNPNTFGGTMSMMLYGNGVVSFLAGGGAVGHAVVGVGPAGGPQGPGRGYISYDTDILQAGQVHSWFSINSTCTNALPALPPGCSQIVSSGNIIGPLPADQQLNWNFPWTTGTITAMNVQLTGQGGAGTTTLSAAGSDSRTAWGAGKITLVAGGTTRRKGYFSDTASIDIVNLTFAPRVPSMSTPGLAAGGLLVLLAVGYAVRRRF